MNTQTQALISKGMLLAAAFGLAACKPTTTDINQVVPAGYSQAISLNAEDLDSSSFIYQVSPPEHGTLSGTAPNLIYTPAAGYTGWDRFTYTASHGDAVSRETLVRLFVEEPAAPDWVTLQGNANHDGYIPVSLNTDDFSLLWQTDLGSASYQPPVGDGQHLFIVADHTLQALRTRDGSQAWQHRFSTALYSVNPPAYAANSVLLQVGKECSDCANKPFLYSFNASTGTQQFASEFSAQWEDYLAPTPFDDTVYVNAGAFGGLQAFDLNSGASAWFTELPQFDSWTPAVNTDWITGYMDGALYLMDRQSGSLLGSIDDPDYSWHDYDVEYAPVLTSQGNAIVAEQGRLLNFNLNQMTLDWQLSEQFSAQPAYADGTIYAINNGTGVQALSAADHSLLWQWDAPASASGAIIVTRNLILISTATTTHALDRTSGAERWQFNSGGHLMLGSDHVLYILSDDGRLSAINTQPDHDDDGLPTWWERRYGLDPYFTDDANADTDGDLLINSEEYAHYSNPTLPDTDGDELSDFDEVSVHGTLVNQPDTDGDNMSDGWEIRHQLLPNDPTDANLDPDGDASNNLEESLAGTDPHDPSSTPPYIDFASYSFEDPQLPAGWETDGSSDWNISTNFASDGNQALRQLPNSNSSLTWSGFFAGNTVQFQAASNCTSFSSLLQVDTGQETFNFSLEASGWNAFTFPVARGFNRIRFQAESDCTVYLDNLQISPRSGWSAQSGAFLATYDESLRLYSASGTVLREVAVPPAGGCCDYPRDLTLLDDGRIAIFNGTFSPQLSLYNPVTHRWTHLQAEDWSLINNGTYGGIASSGDYVYVGNMRNARNDRAGVIRFNTITGQTTFFGETDYIDLTLGLDGVLYALDGRGTTVHGFDLDSLSLINSTGINSARAIAVDANSTLFSATWGGLIQRHNVDGSIDISLDAGGSLFDLNLRADGLLLASDRDGRLFSTSTDLSTFSNIVATNAADFVEVVSPAATSSSVARALQAVAPDTENNLAANDTPDPDSLDEQGFSSSPLGPVRR